MRAYLLGAVFGALCHQRGIMPLHASAIDVGGCLRCVCRRVRYWQVNFGCEPLLGAGMKSSATTSASCDWMPMETCRRGLALAEVRLWEDARAALGFGEPGVERGYSGKQVLRPRSSASETEYSPAPCVESISSTVSNGVTEVTRFARSRRCRSSDAERLPTRSR